MCAFLVPVVVWYTRFLFPLVNSIFPWIVRPPAKLDAREIDLFMRAKLTRRVSKKTIKGEDWTAALSYWYLESAELYITLRLISLAFRRTANKHRVWWRGINWFAWRVFNNDWQWRTCLSAAALFMKENAFICRCLQTLAPQKEETEQSIVGNSLSRGLCLHAPPHTPPDNHCGKRHTYRKWLPFDTGSDVAGQTRAVRLTYDPVLCP